MTDYLRVPAHVVACDLGEAIVVLSYRTGAVHTLLGLAVRWWHDVASSGGDAHACPALETTEVTRVVATLRRGGLLTTAQAPHPWPRPVPGPPQQASWGARELPFGFAGFPSVPRRYLLVGTGALLVTLLVRSCGRRSRAMHRLVSMVRWVSRSITRQACQTQAEYAVHAVRRVGLFAPARAACLEESVAAVLTLALFRRGVRWCHGVLSDPIQLHAWVEMNHGHAVAEPPTSWRYRATLTIPEGTPDHRV